MVSICLPASVPKGLKDSTVKSVRSFSNSQIIFNQIFQNVFFSVFGVVLFVSIDSQIIFSQIFRIWFNCGFMVSNGVLKTFYLWGLGELAKV